MTRIRWWSGLRTAARLLVPVAALLILVEIASFAALRGLAIRDRGRPVAAETTKAYRELPWADLHWREYRQFFAQGDEAHPRGLWRARPFSGETINVDANGIRRTAHSHCDGDIPAIYVLGSASVWGLGSPDWETIPSHLARRFEADGHPACVINLGNDSWGTDDSVIKLIQELKRPGRRPIRHVAFVDGCNNVFAPFLYTGGVDRPWNFHKDWIDAYVQARQGSFGYLAATNTWTLAQRLYQQISPPLARLRTSDPDRLAREIAGNYAANIRIVDGIAHSYGFGYDFFWLPIMTEGEDPIFRLPAEKTLPLIRAAATGRFHDLSGTFDGRSNVRIDVCYLLPEGNRIVADRIYETITRNPARPNETQATSG
jgi:hypothetical protein